ncbi:hypothetical protein AZE42_07881 [Rhizopogon vesiculosus]|uniref:Uncharacterized protein n=1 Tax=Rhizopogon vesiculosus TaxID=180088 RepID=A0A1J8QYI9_9AGAM|nr:hypothetical protein AZE42_07881 [Rhizopogon vesiculosus]
MNQDHPRRSKIPAQEQFVGIVMAAVHQEDDTFASGFNNVSNPDVRGGPLPTEIIPHECSYSLSLETSPQAILVLYIGYLEVWWLMQILEDDYSERLSILVGRVSC